MHGFWDPGALTTEEKGVAWLEGEVGVGACRLCRQQDRSIRCRRELSVACVTGDPRGRDIVHPSTPQGFIIKREATGLYDVERHAEAGAQPDQAPRILGDVRLIKSEAHVADRLSGWRMYGWDNAPCDTMTEDDAAPLDIAQPC